MSLGSRLNNKKRSNMDLSDWLHNYDGEAVGYMTPISPSPLINQIQAFTFANPDNANDI